MRDYQTQKVIDDFFRKEAKEKKFKKQKAKYTTSPINRKQKKKSKVR